MHISLIDCLFLHISGAAKWPMSLSHNRLQTGGWARQQNGEFISGIALFGVIQFRHFSCCDANGNWYGRREHET